MASNDKEIEIKIPIDVKTFNNLKKKLKKIAKFKNSKKQIDEYYNSPHRNFVKLKHPFESLSIRERGNKYILNYKHFHPENTNKFTHCDEFETEIKNPDKLKKIFSALDFKRLITVENDRELYVYNNEFEIALDKVKDLGFFIEIEALKESKNVKQTLKELFKFAKELKLDISKVDKKGYPYLMMYKKGLIK